MNGQITEDTACAMLQLMFLSMTLLQKRASRYKYMYSDLWSCNFVREYVTLLIQSAVMTSFHKKWYLRSVNIRSTISQISEFENKEEIFLLSVGMAGVFSKCNGNSVNSANSENLINHWSMILDQFKDPYFTCGLLVLWLHPDLLH